MFELPQLNYEYNALEPTIDAKTMEIHHTKHHQGYINKLNAALEGHQDLLNMDVEDLLRKIDTVPEDVRLAVRNHGGGHANHSLFWTVISPKGGGQPEGALVEAITKNFGSFDAFKKEFSAKAGGQFGSGWGWLVVNGSDLEVMSTPNQDSPLMEGKTPILGVDVWEHAYYLNYQNRRPDYLESIWKIVDWIEVGRRYDQAMS